MKTVRIEKSKLTSIISSNRDNHKSQFDLAFEGYRKECIAILEQNLAALKEGKRHVVNFFEQAPQDHTEDYERIIQMLSMSVDDVIELTQEEFSQYVQDDWHWRRAWSVSNMKYTQSYAQSK